MFSADPFIKPIDGYRLTSLLDSVSWRSVGDGAGGSSERKALETSLVSGITADSRKVEKGSLFVALTGSKSDGHDFVQQVVAGGLAAVVVVEKGRLADFPVPAFSPGGVIILEVDDTHLAYAQMAANWYGRPAQGLTLVGITGTNGKTTVSYLLESVLKKQGLAVGVIGTVNYRYGDAQRRSFVFPAPFTTPEPLLLQGLLRQMADAGVTIVIMEVSSHALDQQRLGDLQFTVVALTSFSRDHLDYHHDMADYFAAKSLLFSDHLRPGGVAVIARLPEYNGEEEQRVAHLTALVTAQGGRLCECGGPIGTQGAGRDIFPLHIQSGCLVTTISLQVGGEQVQINSSLAGDFNVTNMQTALGIARALGVEAALIAARLGEAAGAPGRLQRIYPAAAETAWRPTVFVDYAHTPDALEKALIALSRLPHRRLLCVFGCGGDRDPGKRAIMGEIAGRQCDLVILTDDNPRSEEPTAIVAQIASGVRAAGLVEQTGEWLLQGGLGEEGAKYFVTIHDRSLAIRRALAVAGADDIVLIAGKGHEQYQQGRAGKRFFDDCLEARKGLTAWTSDSLRLATGGVVGGGSRRVVELGAIVIDSRKVGSRDIFVALRGERRDGHDFLPQVAAAGAGMLVLSQETAAEKIPNMPHLLVADSLRALGDLAGYRRQLLKEVSRPVVVGITGSCGKTTVKEMLAAIFQQHWPAVVEGLEYPEQTLKTQGNLNNLIGLPLSLLPAGPAHKAIILEMGMNQAGEIDRLAHIADPDIACILNIHAAHLEGLGTIDGVARAKEELFAASGKKTTLVVNLDDPLVVACAGKYRQKKIFFSCGCDKAAGEGQEGPQVWASALERTEQGGQRFCLHIGDRLETIILSVPGGHNVANAVAAAAISHAAGIAIAEIAVGLASFRPVDKRMQVVKGQDGLFLLNDTYNANPASMRAGLITLAEQPGERRMAVLGDMLELGPGSQAAHVEIGRCAARQGCHYLALYGDFASATAAGAAEAGMDQARIHIFTDKQAVAPWIRGLVAAGHLQAGDWILLKGSRGMRLEEVVEQLVAGRDE